jgi:hypothetical protein
MDHASDMKNSYKICSESLKGEDHLEYPGVDGRIILKLIAPVLNELCIVEFNTSVSLLDFWISLNFVTNLIMCTATVNNI